MEDNLVRIIEETEAQFAPSTPAISDEEVYRRKIGVVEAGIEDNCKQHGTRGILDHADIMNMIAEYDDEDKQARIFGKFQHLTGLIFKKFNRKIHVIKPRELNPKDWCVIELLDCHPRVPDALMWVAFNRQGTRIIVDELFKEYSSFDNEIFEIKQKANQYRIIQRRADPSAWNEDQHQDKTQDSTAKKFRTKGLEYIPASKKRGAGIRLIKDALDYELLANSNEFVKSPMLYVFENCVRTIFEFEHWQWNEYTGKTAEKRGQSEKPVDKDDHMMEDLGRAFLDPIEFEEMRTYSNNSGQGEAPVLDPF